MWAISKAPEKVARMQHQCSIGRPHIAVADGLALALAFHAHTRESANMVKYTWDHVHIRSPNPEATATWFEKMLGAEVIRSMQQGQPRSDLKLGGANIFIAPVAAGDGVNPPP